jgi:hypothetical protein
MADTCKDCPFRKNEHIVVHGCDAARLAVHAIDVKIPYHCHTTFDTTPCIGAAKFRDNIKNKQQVHPEIFPGIHTMLASHALQEKMGDVRIWTAHNGDNSDLNECACPKKVN